MLSNEGLVGQHYRLKGLARILQIVVSQTLNKWRLLNVGDGATSAAHYAHTLSGRGAGEGVKGRLAADRVGGLEGAAVRLQGLGVRFKVKRAWRAWVDELFGIGGELAGDGPAQGVQGQ